MRTRVWVGWFGANDASITLTPARAIFIQRLRYPLQVVLIIKSISVVSGVTGEVNVDLVRAGLEVALVGQVVVFKVRFVVDRRGHL